MPLGRGQGMQSKGRHLRGGPRSDWIGGWRGSPKRLGGGYCRLQMPLSPALGVGGDTAAGHRLGAGRGGGSPPPPPANASRAVGHRMGGCGCGVQRVARSRVARSFAPAALRFWPADSRPGPLRPRGPYPPPQSKGGLQAAAVAGADIHTNPLPWVCLWNAAHCLKVHHRRDARAGASP